MGRVIVAYEKHDERLLDASTDETFARAAHTLLKERLEAGDFYYDPDTWDVTHPFVVERRKRDERLMELTDAQVDEFPEPVAQAMTAERERIRRAERDADRARRFIEMVRDTVARGERGDFQVKRWRGVGFECPKAWAVLLSRNDAEYERVELRETA